MSTTRPKPIVQGTAAEAVGRAVELLREEWRDGFAGRKIDRARMLIRQAQDLTSDTGISIALARLDVQLDRYQAASGEERKTHLAEIGRDLAAIQDRLPGIVA